MTLMNKFFFILFIFLSNCLWSQKITIQGYVYNQESKEVPHASITLKDGSDNVITFAITDNNGFYSLIFTPENQTHFLFEISSSKFSKVQESWNIEKGKYNYLKNFNLTNNEKELKEITVVGKEKKIVQKGDTTTYKVDKFKDGTEKTVEDLIKKLPGVEVKENGQIKFKGKEVSKVLLDGDDLFNYNYTIGTKNMSIDLLEQVQAIDKFSENPLLKGIENSDKVALNLKLKKGITNFSGNANLGLGYESRYLADFTGLIISKSIKNFSNFQYNNIGRNNSPFDFFSSSVSLEGEQDEPLKSESLLSRNLSSSFLSSKYIFKNSNLFGSTNQVVKISKKTSLRLNFSYFRDDLKNKNDKKEDFFDSNQTSYHQSNIVKNNPNALNGSYKLISNTSPNSLLELSGKINFSEINNTSLYKFNYLPENKINNNQNDLFFNQILNYTYKLNPREVLQLGGHFSLNHLDEKDKYLQSVLLSSEYYNSQEIDQKNYNSNLFLIYLGKKGRFKYFSKYEIKYIYSSLKSKLAENNNSESSINNNLNRTEISSGLTNGIDYSIKKI